MNANTGNTNTVREETIEAALQDQSMAFSELEKSFSELEEKLKPVIKQVPTCRGEEKTTEPRGMPAMSALQENIRSRTQAIMGLCNRLREVRELVDL